MLYDKRWDVESAPVKELEPWQKTVTRMITELEERGWVQNVLIERRGYCLAGVLREVTGVPFYNFSNRAKYQSDNYETAQKVWDKIEGQLGGRATTWNDATGRTKDEVINMLRELVAK